ncbi:MAG: DUF4416 family protein [Gemmatimonadota bacterium]|nr:MAG: DUF4416 family protein [Gemmatimonadota bacterium]
MGKVKHPPKAKLIIAVTVTAEELFEEVHRTLQVHFGPVDLESSIYPFTFTDYYQGEMGSALVKKIFSFERLFDKSELAAIKIQTNGIEEQFTVLVGDKRKRRTNLDPGFVTDSKLVLASTKNFSHRIYIGQGIFAEVTLRYLRKSGFEPLEWTYPDYRTDLARNFFADARQRYMEQARGA